MESSLSVDLFAFRFKRILEGSRAVMLEKEKLPGIGFGQSIVFREVDFEDGDTFSTSHTSRELVAEVAHLGYSWPGVAINYVLVELVNVRSLSGELCHVN